MDLPHISTSTRALMSGFETGPATVKTGTALFDAVVPLRRQYAVLVSTYQKKWNMLRKYTVCRTRCNWIVKLSDKTELPLATALAAVKNSMIALKRALKAKTPTERRIHGTGTAVVQAFLAIERAAAGVLLFDVPPAVAAYSSTHRRSRREGDHRHIGPPAPSADELHRRWKAAVAVEEQRTAMRDAKIDEEQFLDAFLATLEGQ
jgi:hypothetical protein